MWGYDFNYLSLITDAYSKKIVGYHLHTNLSAEGSLEALDTALKSRTRFLPELIHHSDRGTQYCSFDYVLQLRDSDIAISMTEDGEGYENQIAERMNGILKTELISTHYKDADTASKHIARCITIYNYRRRHASLNWQIPQQVHTQKGPQKRQWKNYYQKPKETEIEGAKN